MWFNSTVIHISICWRLYHVHLALPSIFPNWCWQCHVSDSNSCRLKGSGEKVANEISCCSMLLTCRAFGSYKTRSDCFLFPKLAISQCTLILFSPILQTIHTKFMQVELRTKALFSFASRQTKRITHEQTFIKERACVAAPMAISVTLLDTFGKENLGFQRCGFHCCLKPLFQQSIEYPYSQPGLVMPSLVVSSCFEASSSEVFLPQELPGPVWGLVECAKCYWVFGFF